MKGSHLHPVPVEITVRDCSTVVLSALPPALMSEMSAHNLRSNICRVLLKFHREVDLHQSSAHRQS